MNGAMYDEVADFYDRCVKTGWPVHDMAIAHVLEVLGDIHNMSIIDIGCGQGVLSRLLTARGADVVGVDLSQRLLQIAATYNKLENLSIPYIHDDAQLLTKIADSAFDGAVCNLSLMDVQDLSQAFASLKRVLKKGGWFVFTITHPCFRVPAAEYEAAEDKASVKIGRGYFREGSWDPDNPSGRPGEVGEHHRMLSTYINLLVEAGLTIARVLEPETAASELPIILLVKSLNQAL